MNKQQLAWLYEAACSLHQAAQALDSAGRQMIAAIDTPQAKEQILALQQREGEFSNCIDLARQMLHQSNTLFLFVQEGRLSPRFTIEE